jgi:anhydro-N-acetylmuramic acid kinase
MYYIGLMSGTSMDAIDTALVEFGSKAVLKTYREYPIENSLRHQVRIINEKSHLGHIVDLDHKLGHLFANDLLQETNITSDQVIAIGSHGQTILHKPHATHKTSIQISDPNVICAETGITTVADFRRMDMAHGGQGAPLASAFHQYQFQQKNKSIVILNIGGMANLSLLSDSNAIGFDTGPGNALLNDWIQQNQAKEYDAKGVWAKQGKLHKVLLDAMLSDDYFALDAPKSTGREYFNIAWLNNYLNSIGADIAPEDIQATLLNLSSITICDAIKASSKKVDEVIACGGGVHNDLLMKTIQNQLGNIPLVTTEKYGLTPDCIEAVTFAWLAKQRIENKPANLPSVTGANKKVLLGGVYSS